MTAPIRHALVRFRALATRLLRCVRRPRPNAVDPLEPGEQWVASKHEAPAEWRAITRSRPERDAWLAPNRNWMGRRR